MTKTESPPEWLTVEEVSVYLKLSRSKLYDMAQGSEIPCSKVAGRWRFFRPELDDWMLKQRPKSAGTSSEEQPEQATLVASHGGLR